MSMCLETWDACSHFSYSRAAVKMGSPGSPCCLSAGEDTAVKRHSGRESMGEMEVVSDAFKNLVVSNTELLFSAWRVLSDFVAKSGG